MNIDAFVRQVRDLRGHAASLSQRTGDDQAAVALLPEVVDDLFAALEELQIAEQELRQQDEALAEAHSSVTAELHRYQELFNLAPDGYLVTDLAGRIREVNHTAAQLLGVRQHLIAGKPFAVFVALEDRRQFRNTINHLHAVGRLREWDLRLQPRGQAPLDVSITAGAVRDRLGKPIALQFLLRDVGDRKRMEQQLRESAARYRSVIDHAFEAIFQVGVDGRLLTANAAAATMLGYASPEQLLSVVANVRQLYFEPDARELVRLVKAQGTVTGFLFDAHLRHQDGSHIPVSMNVRPSFDAAGAVLGVDVMVLGSDPPAAVENAPLVAVINSDTASLELLQTMLEDGEFVTVGMSTSDLDADGGVAALVEQYNAGVLVYDFAPPYDTSWAQLRRVADDAERGGVKLLVTTANVQVLSDLAGPSPSFESIGKPFEAGQFMGAVQHASRAIQAGAQAQLRRDSAPMVAIFNHNELVATTLQQALEARGVQPVALWSEIRVRDTVHQRRVEPVDRAPRVVIYDIAPPYQENWALFQVVRRVQSQHDTRFVLTTPNRAALERLAGPTGAIEIVNLAADLVEITVTVRQELDRNPRR